MIARRPSLAAFAVLAVLSVSATLPAAPKILYVADPALNMIYGQVLDTDTTNSLVPISGSVTVVASSVAHLSAREIAFVPDGENRVAILDLDTRALSTIANYPDSRRLLVGQGRDQNDLVWTRYDRAAGSTILHRAHRADATGAWTSVQYALAAEPTELFTVAANREAYLTSNGSLYLYTEGQAEPQLLNTIARSSIARGPESQILQYVPDKASTPPKVFDSEGNTLATDPAISAPLMARGPHVVEWRADQPQLAGITRNGGDLLAENTLDTTATVVTLHTTHDENGSVIPERDITGAATLHRISATRWQFYNDAGGMQVIDTSTHRAEYQLQYSAGSGPEFGSIDAIAVGPDSNLYALDSHVRLFRIDPRTGERTILKTFDEVHLRDFIHVRPDGTIVLVEESVDYPLLPAGGVVETWHFRLVTVHDQGGEWVAEKGALALAPAREIVGDLRPIPDGVRMLWRSDRLTRFTDLTMAGTRAISTPWQATSAPPVEEGQSILHRLEFPENGSVPVQAVAIQWNFTHTQLPRSSYPTQVRIHAPSGRISAATTADLRVFDNTGRRVPLGYSDILGTIKLSVKLSATEESAGVWTVESVYGNIAPENMLNIEFLYINPVVMDQDPLFKAALLAMPPDNSASMTVLGGFPPVVRRTDDRFTAVQSAPMQGSDGLNRLRDVVATASGTLYATGVEGFMIWQIDPVTGSTREIIDRRPTSLDPKLLGRNGSSFLRLAIGTAPEYFAASGWIVN